MKRWTKYFSSNREVENNLRSSTTSSVVEWELYDLANKFKRLQRIAVLQTYLFFKLFQAILIRCNLCILSDTTRKFDFQSISFNHRKQNLVNETRCTLFPPPPPCGTPSLIYLSFPHWWRKKWQSSISSSHCRNEEKKERKTRVRSEDDAFLDGRASTAANTPRLIRLGWSFLSTLLRARGFVSSRVVAWLRANASRFSGVDSPPGNEWSGRQEEGSKKSIFLPLLAGRIDGGGGDAQRGRISSLVRGARDVSFQPISRSCESRIFVFWIESRFSSQFF